MIHARIVFPPSDSSHTRGVQFTLYDEDILRFHQLLCRALNTAPPEQNEDWLELAGKLESFIQSNN